MLLILTRLRAPMREGGRAERVIVRCSRGHLYSTTWLPLGSFKAIRLGNTRIQQCPICEKPRETVRVNIGELTPQEIERARRTRDSGIA